MYRRPARKEAQALTRLGYGSRMVVNGDVTQVDLPTAQRSGLMEAIDVLEGVEDIAFVRLDRRDVVRHRLVQRSVDALALIHV